MKPRLYEMTTTTVSETEQVHVGLLLAKPSVCLLPVGVKQ